MHLPAPWDPPDGELGNTVMCLSGTTFLFKCSHAAHFLELIHHFVVGFQPAVNSSLIHRHYFLDLQLVLEKPAQLHCFVLSQQLQDEFPSMMGFQVEENRESFFTYHFLYFS